MHDVAPCEPQNTPACQLQTSVGTPVARRPVGPVVVAESIELDDEPLFPEAEVDFPDPAIFVADDDVPLAVGNAVRRECLGCPAFK